MFITLEGPEGSGKTTAVNYAVNKLEEMGYQIVRTREPGGTPIAEQIRNVILDKANTAMDERTPKKEHKWLLSFWWKRTNTRRSKEGS